MKKLPMGNGTGSLRALRSLRFDLPLPSIEMKMNRKERKDRRENCGNHK
jgi:hypothetical protein